jgi:hypothetical protein
MPLRNRRSAKNAQPYGGFLVGLCDLVGPNWAVFFASLDAGRGGHLGGPATKWGGRGRPAGHAAVPPAVRR